MLPILLDLGFIKIYTFGIFLVLAFFWGSFFLWKNITFTSHKEEEMFDMVFLSLFGGLFTGRLVYIITHFIDFKFDILKYILINGYPGMDLLGTVAGFFLFFFLVIHSKKIVFNRLIDYIIPAILLALAIGKLGSFFSGAEVGSQTTFLISLKYPNLDGYRHLTPLYESILFFIGSYLSYRLMMDIRREKYTEGANFVFFWLVYSFIMVIMDPLKSFNFMVQGISINLLIHGIILLTGIMLVLYYFRAYLSKLLIRKHK